MSTRESVFEKWPWHQSIIWQDQDDNFGEQIPRFDELIDVNWRPGDLSDIVAYLNRGSVHCCIVCDPPTACPLCGMAEFVTSMKRSDGTWSWPDRLPHYVAEHHVRLPNEFVEHIRARVRGD